MLQGQTPMGQKGNSYHGNRGGSFREPQCPHLGQVPGNEEWLKLGEGGAGTRQA